MDPNGSESNSETQNALHCRISILEHRTRRYPSELRRPFVESADPPRGDQHDNVGLIVSCVSVIIDLHGTPPKVNEDIEEKGKTYLG